MLPTRRSRRTHLCCRLIIFQKGWRMKRKKEGWGRGKRVKRPDIYFFSLPPTLIHLLCVWPGSYLQSDWVTSGAGEFWWWLWVTRWECTMKKAAADIKRPVLADSTSQICAAVHPAARCWRDDLKVAINWLSFTARGRCWAQHVSEVNMLGMLALVRIVLDKTLNCYWNSVTVLRFQGGHY